ncbi:MAG: hypothetical protein JWO35_574 [Candidatus Saccharibacteria bacterium]|nr:hypothetical protein [Candidatus Saccharibacteria bacterium]
MAAETHGNDPQLPPLSYIPLPQLRQFPPEGAVYPMEKFTGEQRGNYEFPDDFRLPNLCDSCPLSATMPKQRIARVSGLQHYNIQDTYVTNMAGSTSLVLLMHDAVLLDVEPVVLGELPITSPFSVEHESPTSQVLGGMHNRARACQGSIVRSGLAARLLRRTGVTCRQFPTVSEYNRRASRNALGQMLRFEQADLTDEYTAVVPRL